MKEQTKQCSRCKQVKPFADFNKSAYTSQGIRSHCRSCQKEMRAAYKQSSTYQRKKYPPLLEGSKLCSGCQTQKDVSDFVKDPFRRDGLKPKCKACQSEYWKRLETTEKRKESRKRHHQNPVRKQRLKDQISPKGLKDASITASEYLQIFEKQDGKCAICGASSCTPAETKLDRKKRLAIDHCHTTGKFRGLLCSKCNIGLGYFRDNPEILQNAVSYLQNFQCVASTNSDIAIES